MINREELLGICKEIAAAVFLRRHNDPCLIVAISGPQGCGKTTSLPLLQGLLLADYNIQANHLSLDDYYLPHEQLPPMGRGPPGTHETTLLRDHLGALRAGHPIDVPLFDKYAHGGAGDRRNSSRRIQGCQVLLLEGWLLGFLPRNGEFSLADRALAEYLPIWHEVDLWICLRVAANLWDYVTCRRRLQESEACTQQSLPRDHVEQISAFLERFWPYYERYYGDLPEALRRAFPNTRVVEVTLKDST